MPRFATRPPTAYLARRCRPSPRARAECSQTNRSMPLSAESAPGRSPACSPAADLPPYAARLRRPQHGAEVYATYCSACHGPDGRGGNKASSIVNGSYLALVSDQGLRTIVIVGRPELGAPDWRNNVPGKPMSSQEISDVVAWLAAQRPRFPGQPYRERLRRLRNESNSMTTSTGSSRRALLAKLGLLFNGVIGAILAVPIMRYLMSPVTRGRKPGYESWLNLGELEQFPVSQTRLATFRNPDRRFLGWPNSRYSLLGEKHRRPELPGLCDQLRAPWMSGALVSAVQPLHVSVPRRRLLCRWFARRRSSSARIVPIPLQNRRRKTLHQSRRNADNRKSVCEYARSEAAVRLIGRVGAWLDQRLKLGASIRETAEHPVPRNTASWFYVFGSAALTVFLLQIVTGILLALVYVPSAGEAWNSLQILNHGISARVVHSGPARLGLEFHDRHRPGPHGAGLPLRRVQIPA